MKIVKNKKGTSLLEMIVAISLFSIVLLTTLTVFQSAIEGQARTIATQSTQESLRYVLEMMSKEVRMAKGSLTGGSCITTPRFKVYNTNESLTQNEGTELYFENKDSQCVTYRILNGQIVINRRDAITNITYPVTLNNITVNNLRFLIDDNVVNVSGDIQPKVTIRLSAEMEIGKEINKRPITVETTISSRHYR